VRCNRDHIAALREVTASQGLMLESTSARLCGPGQVHHGSPDKHPEARLEVLRLAGELRVPFTTGILIGIGETRAERIEGVLAELVERLERIEAKLDGRASAPGADVTPQADVMQIRRD